MLAENLTGRGTASAVEWSGVLALCRGVLTNVDNANSKNGDWEKSIDSSLPLN